MASRNFICCSALAVIASLIQAHLSFAETEVSLVQQIYAGHFEGGEPWVCFMTTDTNYPIAFHQWSRPRQEDTELTLVIYSLEEALFDSCTIGAFESLRNAAFEMEIEPPEVRLIYYITAPSGDVVHQSRRDYQCSVPSQLRDHRTDVFYDSAYDLGGFQNLCQ